MNLAEFCKMFTPAPRGAAFLEGVGFRLFSPTFLEGEGGKPIFPVEFLFTVPFPFGEHRWFDSVSE